MHLMARSFLTFDSFDLFSCSKSVNAVSGVHFKFTKGQELSKLYKIASPQAVCASPDSKQDKRWQKPNL